MAGRPGEFDDSSSVEEIREAIRIQEETWRRQQEQYEGERLAGTPREELQTLQREIEARQLSVQRGKQLIAEKSAPEFTSFAPASEEPFSFELPEVPAATGPVSPYPPAESEVVPPTTQPSPSEPPAPALDPLSPLPPDSGTSAPLPPGFGPVPSPAPIFPSVPGLSGPLPSSSTTPTVSGPVIPVPTTPSPAPTIPVPAIPTGGPSVTSPFHPGSVPITDEMRAFAHTHFQGVSETCYNDQLRKIDEAIEANDFYNAVLRQEEQDLIARGQRVPLRVTDGIAKTEHDSQFNIGVLEYVTTNKPIFGIVPDSVATTTTPVAGPGAPTAGGPAGAPAMVPRTKLPIVATGLAAVTFPFSLASKRVRQAMVGRTKEIFKQDSSVPATDTNGRKGWTPGKVVATVGAAAVTVYGVNVIAHGLSDGQQRPEDPSGDLAPAPEDERGVCLLDEEATREQAGLAFRQAEGDPLEAIERAKQDLRELYGEDCEADLVAQHEAIATEEISELATGTPANVPGVSTTTEPTPTTEAPGTTVPRGELSGTVFCEYDESGERVISDNGTPPAVADLPVELQNGQNCSTAPGQVKDVRVPSGEVVREIGR